MSEAACAGRAARRPRAGCAFAPRLWAVVAALLALACATDPPVVEEQVHSLVPGALRKVAIAPFVPAPQLVAQDTPEGVPASEAAELVARFVAEAFEAEGIDVVPPNDLVKAFRAEGQAVPRGDPQALAALAAERFGASAVLLGTLARYVEREGKAIGTMGPASVGYALALYAAPSGERLWTGRFDETQLPLSANLFRTQRYPGGGTRWLTAAELARWGAEHAARQLPEGLR